MLPPLEYVPEFSSLPTDWASMEGGAPAPLFSGFAHFPTLPVHTAWDPGLLSISKEAWALLPSLVYSKPETFPHLKMILQIPN